MSMLAVHPAYWRKGHGTRFVEWSIQLCDIEGITQGVSAAGMGKRLYSRLGYVEICQITQEGDDDDPKGVFTNLMKYPSDGRKSR